MLLTFFIIVVVLGLAFEFAYWLLAFAILWVVPILVALATMPITLAQYPDDPGKVFWAFVFGALGTRFAIGCLAFAADESRR
jgi:hypothetical protein